MYFSPNGGIQKKIASLIQNSTSTIEIAMYSFTADPLEAEVISASKRNVKVRIILDKSQSKGKFSSYQTFKQYNLDVHLLKGKDRGIMHDKIGIFDGKEIVFGSYNWTNNAELNNYENAYFTTNKDIVEITKKEFETLWQKAIQNGN